MKSTRKVHHLAGKKHSSSAVLERIKQGEQKEESKEQEVLPTELPKSKMTPEQFFAEKGFTPEQIAHLMKNYQLDELRDMAWMLRQKTSNNFHDLIKQFEVTRDPQVKVLLTNITAILFREVDKNKSNQQPFHPLLSSAEVTFELLMPFLIRIMTHAFPQGGKKGIEDLSFADKEQLMIVALINLNRYLKHSGEILRTRNLFHLFACSLIETCRTNLERYFFDTHTATIFGLGELKNAEQVFLNGLNHKLFMLKVEKGDLEYELMSQGVRTGLNNGFSLSMLRAPELEEYKEPEPVFQFKPDASKLNKEAMQFRPQPKAGTKRKLADEKGEATEQPDFKEMAQPANKRPRTRR